MKKAAVMKTEEGPAIPALPSAEETALQHNAARSMVESIPGGTCSEPWAECRSSYVCVKGHSLILLPPAESEPAHSHWDETPSDDSLDEDMDPSSSPERADAAGGAAGGSSGESTKAIKALYRLHLIKEMESRDQEMAYRALKMRKLEKEILLLDKQLDKR